MVLKKWTYWGEVLRWSACSPCNLKYFQCIRRWLRVKSTKNGRISAHTKYFFVFSKYYECVWRIFLTRITCGIRKKVSTESLWLLTMPGGCFNGIISIQKTNRRLYTRFYPRKVGQVYENIPHFCPFIKWGNCTSTRIFW